MAGVHARARPERPPAERGVVARAQGEQGALRQECRRRRKGHTVSNVACAQAALWCPGVLVFWCSGVLVFWYSGVHTLHGALTLHVCVHRDRLYLLWTLLHRDRLYLL